MFNSNHGPMMHRFDAAHVTGTRTQAHTQTPDWFSTEASTP